MIIINRKLLVIGLLVLLLLFIWFKLDRKYEHASGGVGG